MYNFFLKLPRLL